MVTTRRQSRSASAGRRTPDFAVAQGKVQESTAQPKTTEFEFMGPVGTGFMLLGLTGFVYFLCVACSESGWPNLSWRPSLSELHGAWSWKAFGVVCGWFTFQAILYYIAPGKWVKGVKLQDGTQLEYPINGKKHFPQALTCTTHTSCSVLCAADHGCCINHNTCVLCAPHMASRPLHSSSCRHNRHGLAIVHISLPCLFPHVRRVITWWKQWYVP